MAVSAHKTVCFIIDNSNLQKKANSTVFIDEINSYINWYNSKRIKQSLGYMSPTEYRHSLGLTA